MTETTAAEVGAWGCPSETADTTAAELGAAALVIMVEAGGEEAMAEDIIIEEDIIMDEEAMGDAAAADEGELAADGFRVTPTEPQSCWAKTRAATERCQSGTSTNVEI